jgi:hypothetical protein
MQKEIYVLYGSRLSPRPHSTIALASCARPCVLLLRGVDYYKECFLCFGTITFYSSCFVTKTLYGVLLYFYFLILLRFSKYKLDLVGVREVRWDDNFACGSIWV